MAVDAGAPACSPQIVGIAFVERYYLTLHQFPEKAHKFYEDISELSRPGLNGEMTSVTTLQGIEDTILSWDCKNFQIEILTADAQLSYKEGIIVLVTGLSTGKDGTKRKFTQSFFLAPQQDKVQGYFVLNDVFRYIDEKETLRVDTVCANGVHEKVSADHCVVMDTEPAHVPHQPIQNDVAPLDEATKNEEEVHAQLDSKARSVMAKEAAVSTQLDSRQSDVSSVAELASSNIQVDGPKKTYASIVKAMKDNATPVYVAATTTLRVEPAKPEQKLRRSPSSEASVHSNNSNPNSNNDHAQVKSYSVHIRNLPMSTRVEQIERSFKKFGTIKQDGIQVRSFKDEGNCFAFVDFENSSDMQKAVKASPIKFDGGCEVTVAEKKTTSQASNGRGRYPPRRDGFRNDKKDHGNFSNGRSNRRNEGGRSNGRNEGGRSNGRKEGGNRESSSHRTRGPPVLDEDGFQMVR